MNKFEKIIDFLASATGAIWVLGSWFLAFFLIVFMVFGNMTGEEADNILQYWLKFWGALAVSYFIFIGIINFLDYILKKKNRRENKF